MQKTEERAETPDKARIVFGPEPAEKATERKPAEPTVAEIKAKIAETVRTNAEKHSMVTPADVVFALVPGSRPEDKTAILDEMAADERYADIKAVTTASGGAFFFSLTYIDPDQATSKSRIEETKLAIAEKVRGDSKNAVKLTSVGDLHDLVPGMEPDEIAAVLDGMQADPKYADVKSVTASTGDHFFYSNRHMSDYYALVLSRVAANDPCATIAAMVRDESRIYPRPTCVQVFTQDLFHIALCELRPIVDAMLQKPEYEDIKLMVHPKTGGVYLYSSRYLEERIAWAEMHYQEVVVPANP